MSGLIQEIEAPIEPAEISAPISVSQQIGAAISNPVITATISGLDTIAGTITGLTVVSGQGGGKIDPPPDPHDG